MGNNETGLSPIVFRRGKRINLRPLDESDFSLLWQWVNDPEISNFFPRHRPMTAVMEKKWLEKRLAGEDNSYVVFGITLAENHKLIGTASLHRIDWVHGTAWVGIAIGQKDCWGQGCGSEAVMLILDYAFNQLNLRKACWGALGSNKRSIGCAEKCGFREEGRMKAQFRRGDDFIDDVSLGVFREDWFTIWQNWQSDK